MPFAMAEESAAERGIKLRDKSVTGWYTQEYQSRRVEVTVDDTGTIITAVQG